MSDVVHDHVYFCLTYDDVCLTAFDPYDNLRHLTAPFDAVRHRTAGRGGCRRRTVGRGAGRQHGR